MSMLKMMFVQHSFFLYFFFLLFLIFFFFFAKACATPLHNACEEGNIEIIELLCVHKADAKLQNEVFLQLFFSFFSLYKLALAEKQDKKEKAEERELFFLFDLFFSSRRGLLLWLLPVNGDIQKLSKLFSPRIFLKKRRLFVCFFLGEIESSGRSLIPFCSFC